MNQTYRVYYRPGAVNQCPGCAGTSWHVGRFSAECARCGCAIEIAAHGRRTGWRVAA